MNFKHLTCTVLAAAAITACNDGGGNNDNQITQGGAPGVLVQNGIAYCNDGVINAYNDLMTNGRHLQSALDYSMYLPSMQNDCHELKNLLGNESCKVKMTTVTENDVHEAITDISYSQLADLCENVESLSNSKPTSGSSIPAVPDTTPVTNPPPVNQPTTPTQPNSPSQPANQPSDIGQNTSPAMIDAAVDLSLQKGLIITIKDEKSINKAISNDGADVQDGKIIGLSDHLDTSRLSCAIFPSASTQVKAGDKLNARMILVSDADTLYIRANTLTIMCTDAKASLKQLQAVFGKLVDLGIPNQPKPSQK